jgi:ATP-binding cassette subfamily F protein 3
VNHRTLISISHLYADLPNRRLFEDFSVSLAAGEIVAIVGPNGCGKSTLLHMIDTARVAANGAALFDQLETRGVIRIKSDIDLIHVTQRSVPDLPSLSHGSAALSDGERQKARLAEAIRRPAEVYLFDEPTNYLDIDGIVRFESEVLTLRACGAGILLVSHDRRLINNLADRTVYISQNGVYATRGGYSSAQTLAQTDISARQHKAATIALKIRQLETEARTRLQWAANKEKSKRGAGARKPFIAKAAAKMAARAKTAQAKADKEIERLAAAKPFVPKPVQLRLPEYEVRHRTVCSIEDLSFAYELTDAPVPILQNVTLGLSTTDRICLVGTNGTGKSTLLKLIAGLIQPTVGRLRVNEGVRIRYLPQNLTGYFQGNTLLEALLGTAADEATVRTLLGGVMIRGDKVHQSLASLSPGELTRAALVRAMVDRAEFLLFDEPTSHLDIESVEVLEQALRAFPGGYLVVSHDRSFVATVADTLYVMAGGRLKPA